MPLRNSGVPESLQAFRERYLSPPEGGSTAAIADFVLGALDDEARR